MNTFVTILVEHVEGADQSTLIPSDGCVRLYPVAPVKDGSVLTHKGVGIQLTDGRPADGGVWVWPGRYTVTAAGRRWDVDIPAGHTAEAPFNLATAVPVDPAAPLPWAPTADDLLLVKEAADAASVSASSARSSADEAARERLALEDAIAHGEYRGEDGHSPVLAWEGTALVVDGVPGPDLKGEPGADGASVVSIADEDGDGTATVTYSDGRSEPLPLPRGLRGEPGRDGVDGEDGADSTVPGPANTLTIGTVTTGAQAAATITGDAPAQTLSLVLPKAERGEPGPPGGTYVPSSDLVGPGRPDQPATTGGLVTGQETVGTIYRSTDGAGVGAWAWAKRPTRWEVVDGSTGGRYLTKETDPAALIRGEWAYLTRVGTLVSLYVQDVPREYSQPIFTPPAGFGVRGRANIGGSSAGNEHTRILVSQTLRRNQVTDPVMLMNAEGQIRYHGSAVTDGIVSVRMSWHTYDQWPGILPGQTDLLFPHGG